jgi:hypothetical protein
VEDYASLAVARSPGRGHETASIRAWSPSMIDDVPSGRTGREQGAWKQAQRVAVTSLSSAYPGGVQQLEAGRDGEGPLPDHLERSEVRF